MQTVQSSGGGQGDESDDANGEEGDAFYDDEDAFEDVESAPENLRPGPGEGNGDLGGASCLTRSNPVGYTC